MKNNIGFICPVCKKPLVKNEKSYICENGHNFDIAKIEDSAREKYFIKNDYVFKNKVDFLNYNIREMSRDEILIEIQMLLCK